MSNEATTIHVRNEDEPSKFVIQESDSEDEPHVRVNPTTTTTTNQTSNSIFNKFQEQKQREEQRSVASDRSDESDFNMYMNPAKKRKVPLPIEEDDEEEHYRQNRYESDSVPSSSYHHNRRDDDRSEASSKFSTVQQKVQYEREFKLKELLYELDELQARGYISHNKYSIRSRLKDVENEVRLGRRYFEHKSYQNLFEEYFFTLVYGIENSTCLYNPLNLDLNGLHDALSVKRNEVSHNIRLIVKKYIGDDGDGLMPPEVNLLLILCATVFTTVIGNKFSNMAEKNPAGFGTMMGNMLKGAFGDLGKALPRQQQQQQQPRQTNTTQNTSPDLRDLFSHLTPSNTQTQQQPPQPQIQPGPNEFLPNPQHTRQSFVSDTDRIEVSSIQSDDTQTSSRRARRKFIKNKNPKNNKRSINIF
jgi:hypothetical protein